MGKVDFLEKAIYIIFGFFLISILVLSIFELINA